MAARRQRAAIRSAVAKGYGGLRPAAKPGSVSMAPGGMRQRLEPRQAGKAAVLLDGVNQAKDVIRDFRVVRMLLEPHHWLSTVSRFSLVSVRNWRSRSSVNQTLKHPRARSHAFYGPGQFRWKAFKFG
jgi:hypothetical protein